MRKILVITRATVRSLRRDQIFWPLLLWSCFVVAAAVWLASLAVLEQRRVLLDVSTFFFRLSLICLGAYWGSRLLAARSEMNGFQQWLLTPLSRTGLVFGRFLGLAVLLLCYSVFFAAVFHGAKVFYHLGGLLPQEAVVFGFTALEGLVVASLALALSIAMRPGVTLAATFFLWLAGVLGGSFSGSSKPLQALAKIWNLQRFHLEDSVLYLPSDSFFWTPMLTLRAAYGAALVLFFVLLASSLLRPKDL